VTDHRVGPLPRLVDSDRFNAVIAAVIIANAIVLGLETYPEVMADHSRTLETLNAMFYAVFVVELLLRIASYGRRPQDFLRSGWNVFDLVIVGAVLLPGVREQAQLLRLLRLARVVRLVRFLPDARMLVLTVVKSLPSVFSMVVLTLLLLFVYGMIGWSLFGPALPDSWGTIGRAMLTLFILLTLENFPTYLAEAEPVSPYAVPFFVSYVLLAAFIVFNLLIGIVIGSMEKARAHDADAAGTESPSMPQQRPPATAVQILDRIEALRRDVAELESDLRARLDDGGASCPDFTSQEASPPGSAAHRDRVTTQGPRRS
jgi:voltage-gated sodium channel